MSAIHVYLSIGQLQADGVTRLNPKTGKVDNNMRYRGELAPSDDLHTYTEKMAAQGHIVEAHSSLVGSLNTKTGHIEYPIGSTFPT